MKRSANHHAKRCRELADILIVPLREVARRHGYALAVHGSLSYDIDLIACPWRDLATSQESLAEAIHAAVDAIVGQSKSEGPEQKPYGRLAWSFHMGGGPYGDLTVMPANDDVAGNLSFFFSNGMEPEYSVIGRVARRIWAVAMKNRYGANERSQKLKYHIQTSGRTLHAQEMDFNDIRTTLQALIAIYDNCNSLHTNAYDEAITTPTEESVRRAMAIQLIINREWGVAKNENPNQGAFIMEELTDLVEEAVLKEFEAIASRGGVLGAMETGYQRGKIQEESMHYEHKKHDGSYPIIGVNTFLSPRGSGETGDIELARSTEAEKQSQLTRLADFQGRNAGQSPASLARLKQAVIDNGNVFEVMMDAVRCCSLGQISNALYEVGGQYRRSM